VRRVSRLALVFGIVAIGPIASAEPPPPPHARVHVLAPHAPRDSHVRAELLAFVRTQTCWLTPPFLTSVSGVATLPEYELDIRVTETELTTTHVHVTVTLCVERRGSAGGTVCVSDEATALLSFPAAASIERASDAAAQRTWSAAQDFIDAP